MKLDIPRLRVEAGLPGVPQYDMSPEARGRRVKKALQRYKVAAWRRRKRYR